MEMNDQIEEIKTEDNNTKSVSIEINDEKYKENSNKNDLSLYNTTNTTNQILDKDYLIEIKKIPILNIKYFKFGKTIFFYFSCCLKEKKYLLSEIQTPPFTLGPECKSI